MTDLGPGGRVVQSQSSSSLDLQGTADDQETGYRVEFPVGGYRRRRDESENGEDHEKRDGKGKFGLTRGSLNRREPVEDLLPLGK